MSILIELLLSIKQRQICLVHELEEMRMASASCSHCSACHTGAEVKDGHSSGRHKMSGAAGFHLWLPALRS